MNNSARVPNKTKLCKTLASPAPPHNFNNTMTPDTAHALAPAYPVIPAQLDTGGATAEAAFGLNPQLAVCSKCELCVVSQPKESKRTMNNLVTLCRQPTGTTGSTIKHLFTKLRAANWGQRLQFATLVVPCTLLYPCFPFMLTGILALALVRGKQGRSMPHTPRNNQDDFDGGVIIKHMCPRCKHTLGTCTAIPALHGLQTYERGLLAPPDLHTQQPPPAPHAPPLNSAPP